MKRKSIDNSLKYAVQDICRPIFAKIYGAALFLDWAAVVGSEIASFTAPKSISRDRETLTVLVQKERLLEMQYRSHEILERVHEHLGEQSIQRIVLKSKVFTKKNSERIEKTNNIFTNMVLDIDDKDVRSALIRLSERVKS